ncbi:MAG: response regulator transcription factor [Clostridiales bacterium]|nr:response regulator transcription factor [Clostridiales bacterium]
MVGKNSPVAEKTILIADDDRSICEMLELHLSHAGFRLLFCYDGSEAIRLVREEKPDLVLLDLMLPVINGWEACRMIKHISNVPVIMITARDMLEDKLQGFESGADDYIVKPFHTKEVIARINARLKDAPSSTGPAGAGGEVSGEAKDDETTGGYREEGILTAGRLTVDISRYSVRIDGKSIDLKPKEIQLLHFLLLNRGIVFNREQLLDKVWNYDFMGDTRTVDVHIKSLRKKLEPFMEGAGFDIRTIWGVGYKLEVE